MCVKAFKKSPLELLISYFHSQAVEEKTWLVYRGCIVYVCVCEREKKEHIESDPKQKKKSCAFCSESGEPAVGVRYTVQVQLL